MSLFCFVWLHYFRQLPKVIFCTCVGEKHDGLTYYCAIITADPLNIWRRRQNKKVTVNDNKVTVNDNSSPA